MTHSVVQAHIFITVFYCYVPSVLKGIVDILRMVAHNNVILSDLTNNTTFAYFRVVSTLYVKPNVSHEREKSDKSSET